MADFAVFGAAGAIGRSVGAELDRRGVPYRVVGRRREPLDSAFPRAEIVTADLLNPAAAAVAARGARFVIYAVGLPYTAFRMHPVIMRTVLESAAAEGVEGVVVISSVYSYGRPRSQRVAEDHPREPATRKGEFRKQQEDAAIEADRAGRVHAMVVHLPDFYGPFADLSLANPMFDAALKGKRATWLGSPDLPHEFLFVPDAGPPIVELVLRGDCWGERWNLAGAGAIPAREFIRMIYQEAGREPRFQKVGRTVLRVAGIFSPFMREVAEMFYLYETPVILDDSRLRARLGDVHQTSYADGAARTMAWLKAERVQGDPRGTGSPPYLRSPESRA